MENKNELKDEFTINDSRLLTVVLGVMVFEKGHKSPQVYIVDFLNVFSDYREIKYKKKNIDFHTVKHENKLKDTREFFELFFTRYIDFMHIDKTSKFIFVMKKLNEYEHLLEEIVELYQQFDMKLMIIENKYTDNVMDKSKDDFLCQYIFQTMQRRHNVTLISNDKYRDRQSYINLFTLDILLRTISWNKGVQNESITLQVSEQLSKRLAAQKCTRCTIPKRKLGVIL